MATIINTITQSLSDSAARPFIDISNADFVSVQIDGTFVGTWVFQASLDNSSWANFAMHQISTTTATTDVATGTTTGFFTKPCTGLKYLRCILNAYTSGTANFIITQTMLEK
jgi:hypothetical protein